MESPALITSESSNISKQQSSMEGDNFFLFWPKWDRLTQGHEFSFFFLLICSLKKMGQNFRKHELTCLGKEVMLQNNIITADEHLGMKGRNILYTHTHTLLSYTKISVYVISLHTHTHTLVYTDNFPFTHTFLYTHNLSWTHTPRVQQPSVYTQPVYTSLPMYTYPRVHTQADMYTQSPATST